MKRFGLPALACLLLVASATALAEPPSAGSAVCRDERAVVSELQDEVARLSAQHDAILAIFQGTLPANVSLEDVLAPEGNSDEPGAGAQAAAGTGPWPQRLQCDSLQDQYQLLRNDMLWLRDNMRVKRQMFRDGLPESFRAGLHRIWISRQRLQLQFDELQAALAANGGEASEAAGVAVGEINARLRDLRLGVIRLMPDLIRGVTADRSARFLQLWEQAFSESPHARTPSAATLAALPPELQGMTQTYVSLAERDAVAMRDLLNDIRAWLWMQRATVFRTSASERSWHAARLLRYEGYAVRNSIDLLGGEVAYGLRARSGGDSAVAWRVALFLEYVLGLALFPLLAFLAKKLVQPVAAFHQRIARYARSSRIALQLSRMTAAAPPLAPWLAGWFGLDLLSVLFSHHGLGFLVALVPLARLYILYGLFRLLGEWLVLRVAQQGGVYLSGEQAGQIEGYAGHAAMVLMLPWLLKDLAYLAIGPSLLLDACLWITGAAVLLALGLLLRNRRQDLVAALQSLLPPGVDPWVAKLLRGRFFLVFAPLTVVPLVMTFALQFVHKAMLNFDGYRKLAARGFKLRACSGEGADGEAEVVAEVSEEYGRWFADDADGEPVQLPFIDTGLKASIRNRIDPWLTDRTEEDTLLLSGQRGIGKTAALRQLQEDLASDYPGVLVKHAYVPAKTLAADAVTALIGKLLDTDLAEGPAALVKSDAERAPTVLILDNAQNFFMRRVGGLEGWQTLLGLTNARLNNVYWLIVINNQSWAYLGNVFGRDYQFRNQLRARPWSQTEIRSLILSRNQLSGFRIRYDNVLLASRGPDAGNVRNAEQRYFSLLWDASRGNPMFALRLWMSSLRTEGRSVIVGLPMETSAAVLERLGSDLHFVYAAIVMHENMTSGELVESTALPDSMVRSALKTGFDAGFLRRSPDGRYRVAPIWYDTITRLLSRKNLLNE